MTKKRGSLLPLFFTFNNDNLEITRLFFLKHAASINITQEGEKMQ